MRHSKEAIKKAWKKVWAAAINEPGRDPLMSIPPNPQEDVDLILSDAMAELFELREEVERRERAAYEAGVASVSWDGAGSVYSHQTYDEWRQIEEFYNKTKEEREKE